MYVIMVSKGKGIWLKKKTFNLVLFLFRAEASEHSRLGDNGYILEVVNTDKSSGHKAISASSQKEGSEGVWDEGFKVMIIMEESKGIMEKW